jgi:glycerol-3-phosphate dehydrogenase
MKRELAALARTEFDLLIVGGGIYGACAANEAALRGLSVALIEKADFGGATSANSLKIIHGGLRYLQQLDLVRVRESIRERTTLLRIAPHLVHPMPVAVPTYGHGMKSRELMLAALALNDAVSCDRNRGADAAQRIPNGYTVSHDEALRLLPGIAERGLTGAAIFTDAQVYNSERLTLAFVRSAEQAGAVVANYVEAAGLLRDARAGGRVAGALARDTLTGEGFDIRARVVINMAGPWASLLLNGHAATAGKPLRLAKAINVITRQLFEGYAVGIASKAIYRERDAVIDKRSRLLFVAPWRGRSIVGTDYIACESGPDAAHIDPRDIERFVDEVNDACPGARLDMSDVLFVHQGLLPMADVDARTGSVRLVKHYSMTDERNGGIGGLLTVVGVKYTTARDVAQKAVDRACELMGQTPPPSRSATTPVYGGQIEHLDEYLAVETKAQPAGLRPEVIKPLILNYGSAYHEVLDSIDDGPVALRTLPESDVVLKAQIRHSVREEMAVKLGDVVFRRTELGSAGHPGDDAVAFCVNVMSAELGWNSAHLQRELDEVTQAFHERLAFAGGNDSTRGSRRDSERATDGTELADPAVQQIRSEAA